MIKTMNSLTKRLRVKDNVYTEFWAQQLMEEAANTIDLLYLAIDNLLEDIDTDHQPEWASEEDRRAGKDPWCCRTCGPADGGWPCTHRMALNELKAVRNGIK